jgi:hypothetical protein
MFICLTAIRKRLLDCLHFEFDFARTETSGRTKLPHSTGCQRCQPGATCKTQAVLSAQRKNLERSGQ